MTERPDIASLLRTGVDGSPQAMAACQSLCNSAMAAFELQRARAGLAAAGVATAELGTNSGAGVSSGVPKPLVSVRRG